MAELARIADKVRSKNAGPFWLTIDIFCPDQASYQRVVAGLSTLDVANALGTTANAIKRFDIADLNVVKFSLPRPQIQGSHCDRDMHGASWAALIGALEI